MISKQNNEIYDVVIIGAGFSGLSAALELEKANKKLKILILEADDTVGGRSFNKYLKDGTLLELGGQWIGSRHEAMFELVKQFNLETFVTPPYNQGKEYYFYQGRLQETLSPEFYEIARQLDNMANTVDLEEPWNHPNAEEWDNITFQEYIDQIPGDKEIKKLLSKIIIGGILSTEGNRVSLLQTLFYLHSSGGFDYSFNAIGGAQNYRIVGGIFQIAEKIAEQLQNTKIYLNQEVKVINDLNKKVLITTNLERTFQAKHCILAISPVAVNNIKFVKPFPTDYQNLLNSYQSGRALKVNFTFSEPFWVKDNKSGTIVSNSGWLTEIVDNSTPDSSNGVLTAFIYGDKREEIVNYSLKKRKNMLIADLVKYFGPKAAHVKGFVGFNWQYNSWTGGCFSATLCPGALFKYGKFWKQPYGLLHFASTETSSYFYGYFEGAVLSGKRSAAEIIKKISNTK